MCLLGRPPGRPRFQLRGCEDGNLRRSQTRGTRRPPG
jgi:hypothetical protein